jgi:hypothetical protein
MRWKVGLRKKPKPLNTNGAQFSNLINFDKKIIMQETQFQSFLNLQYSAKKKLELGTHF